MLSFDKELKQRVKTGNRQMHLQVAREDFFQKRVILNTISHTNCDQTVSTTDASVFFDNSRFTYITDFFIHK